MNISKMSPGQVVTSSEYNRLVDAINRNSSLTISGPGTSISKSAIGMAIAIRKLASTGGGEMFIAEVDSDAAGGGGGYYNCHLQTLDATDWDSTTAVQLDDTGDSVVVLNLAEIGTSVHNLDAGDLIMCFNFTDDEGNTRLVGNEVFGRHTFGEW